MQIKFFLMLLVAASRGLANEPPRPILPPARATEVRESQAAWSKHLGRAVKETNSIGADMILIPPGRFHMGSPKEERGRESGEDQIAVTLTKPFYLSQTEVTQGQWRKVMGTAPWSRKTYVKIGESLPAQFVSWQDAQQFCRKLSESEGKSYRLPSEAEWEWACRAGTTTRYSFGDNDGELGNYAWFGRQLSEAKDARFVHPVGQKLPNAFGLVDMHGNVLEWCQDAYEKQYNGGDNVSVSDPKGPASGSIKVLRGGSWFSQSPEFARSAKRFFVEQGHRDHDAGFRIACDE